MNKCYYQLNSWEIIAFVFRKGEASYFRVTSLGRKLIKVLKLDGRLRPLDFHFYELLEADGGSSIPALYQQDLLFIVNRIAREISANKFLLKIGSIFDDSDKVPLFFKKNAHNTLEQQVVALKALIWIKKSDGKATELVLPWSPFVPPFAEYAAQKYKIKVVSCYTILDFFLQIAMLVLITWRFVKEWLTALINLKIFEQNVEKARLGNLYTIKGFSFAADKRSDFPWLLPFPGEQALLYFEREDLPATEAMVEELRGRHISSVALTAKATTTNKVLVYRPSYNFIAKSIKPILKVLCYYCRYGKGLRSLNYLAMSLRFIFEYARFYDFYDQQGIKVNVDFVDFDPLRLARQIALKDNNGVSVSYQVSNWPIVNSLIISGADAMFIFGPYYLQRMKAIGSICGRYIINGYLTDYSFAAVKNNSNQLRTKLKAAGAKLIVSYFDENSSDERMSIIPNARSAKIYKRLLNAVLADDSLGLICSPKRPKTLLKRVPEIAALIDRAKATGRCVFIDGQYGTESYPAEPSQAADITITLLLGGTTALECYLAGSRVVYLDLEKLYAYEEYQWGKGTLVFDDLETLMSAIDQVRRDPSAAIGRADLIPNLKEKDPFQDGQAARRMATYLENLLEKLNQGANRQAALAYADEQYAKAWGSDKIVKESQWV